MTRDEVHALLMAFRGVEAAVSYGHPSYKVREKFFTWFWPETPDCLVVQLDSREQRDMLAEAEQKAQALPENRPFFICQPMQRLRLAEPVDAVICALDSLNYVTKPADCRKTFRRVYDALTPGGLFVFDINTPAKLRGLDGQVFLDETDDTYCVWRTEFDEKKRLCYYGMDIFRLEGEHWQRSFEEHIEYAYEPAELQQWLAEAGFTRIRSYGDRVLRAPKEAEQRIYFSAKKE